MSFDVFAQAFRAGDTGVGNVAGALAILSKTPHKHSPQFGGGYDIDFADGSHLVMYGGLDGERPYHGAMFKLWGLSEPLAELMFQFTLASNCVLLPGSVGIILLTNANQTHHIPPPLRKLCQIFLISSGLELLVALGGGYDAWRAFRDKSGGGPSSSEPNAT